MGRPRRDPPLRPVTPSASELDLTEILNTRVSPKVKRLVKETAKRAGISPTTWVRMRIHDALGLNKD